jgi:hypothetical protein
MENRQSKSVKEINPSPRPDQPDQTGRLSQLDQLNQLNQLNQLDQHNQSQPASEHPSLDKMLWAVLAKAFPRKARSIWIAGALASVSWGMYLAYPTIKGVMTSGNDASALQILSVQPSSRQDSTLDIVVRNTSADALVVNAIGLRVLKARAAPFAESGSSSLAATAAFDAILDPQIGGAHSVRHDPIQLAPHTAERLTLTLRTIPAENAPWVHYTLVLAMNVNDGATVESKPFEADVFSRF